MVVMESRSCADPEATPYTHNDGKSQQWLEEEPWENTECHGGIKCYIHPDTTARIQAQGKEAAARFYRDFAPSQSQRADAARLAGRFLGKVIREVQKVQLDEQPKTHHKRHSERDEWRVADTKQAYAHGNHQTQYMKQHETPQPNQGGHATSRWAPKEAEVGAAAESGLAPLYARRWGRTEDGLASSSSADRTRSE